MKKISCRANDSTSAVFPLDNPWKAVINIMDGPIRIRVDMKIRIPGTAAASSFGSALKMATACGAKISSITVARPSSAASANDASRTAAHSRLHRRAPKQKPTMGNRPCPTPMIGMKTKSEIRTAIPSAASATDPYPATTRLNMVKVTVSVNSITVEGSPTR